MTRRFASALLLVSLVAVTASAQTFVFRLDGGQVVPPVSSTSQGGCHGLFDSPASALTVTCVHDVPGAVLVLIHRGPVGANGPVLANLGAPASPVAATWAGLTPADVSDLLAGNLYASVTSAAHPGGEIRGQILPRTVDTVAFTAGGDQVVPPSGSPATASCTADLDGSATSLAIQCSHDLPGAADAGVQVGPWGAVGPRVFTFASATSPFSGGVPMTPTLIASFAAGFLYVEVRGSGDPPEEIRGQVGGLPAPPPSLSIGDVTSAEGTGGTTAFVFPLTLSRAAGGPVSVGFATADGSATSPGDFASTSGTATFAPGATAAAITVEVVGDGAFEHDEDFAVTLGEVVGATVADGQGVGTILDDDDPAADLSIVKQGPASVLAGETVAYALMVSNAGPQAGSDVVVTDALPATTGFLSATPSQGSCAGTTTVTCSLGTLNAGSSATVAIVVRAPLGPSELVNSASVANAAEHDPDPSDDVSEAVATTVREAPAIPTLSPAILLALIAAIAAAAILRLR